MESAVTMLPSSAQVVRQPRTVIASALAASSLPMDCLAPVICLPLRVRLGTIRKIITSSKDRDGRRLPNRLVNLSPVITAL